MPHDQLIAAVFAAVFAAHEVRLVAGAKEPRYVAATARGAARLHYTSDFASSALHEAAHWCLAGKRRRALDDFGFSYVPAAQRSSDDQLRFEAAEVRTQALEWLFSLAARVEFHLSVDNVDRERGEFRAAVLREVRARLATGLPPRALRFRAALAQRFNGVAAPCWATVCRAAPYV